MLPKKILVPVDFGEASDRAVAYALSLARRLDAEVIVMHAYEIPVVGFPDGALIATSDVASRIVNGAQTALAEVMRRNDTGVPLKTMLKQEAPWRAILEVIEETGADLVVMGTHGRRGLPRALLGSVAEKLVRTAPCPVLTVRTPEGTS